jgi:hypothetical protein
MKTRNANGAANRLANTTTYKNTFKGEVALCSPQELAAALAVHIRREDGMIPIQVTVRGHATELVLAARRARECGETIDEVIEHVTLNGRDDRGGLLEALRDYEGKLPEKK